MKFTCELTRIENPNEQQLGRKPARHDHLAWSEDPPFLRELYSLFPKVVLTSVNFSSNKDNKKRHQDQIECLPRRAKCGGARRLTLGIKEKSLLGN
ncbi:hypothetical protein SFRURICE_008339 [Spodoptera frugiperda]|uniref:SFRICE_040592 n=1 Tax=Spodoptera frugiperda TaxID=7108 RepID=A0A2H1W3J8_SPOFR|nr:hypothetical protein SFRURICE_008339 [Spodoptera frugiperda]